MVEILKMGDKSTGTCTPQDTLFTNLVGITTNVFIGAARNSVLVEGDVCAPVECTEGPPIPDCIPTLITTSCSPNVFAGPTNLPVGIVGGILTCEYAGVANFISLVNVN